MRKHLPEGKEGHNVDHEKLTCPICSSRLIPAEIIYSDNSTELWYVECRTCRTEYLTRQPAGRLEVPKPITREYIFSLEQRISQLEEIINTLTRNNIHEVKRAISPQSQYAFLLNT